MRILVLKANYFPQCGAGRLLEAFLPALDRARVEPVLAEIETEGQPSSAHFVSPWTRGLEHHRLPWRGARRARPVVAALRQLIAERRIDAVNSHDMRCDLLCRLGGVRRGLSVPWVAHVHGWAGSAGSARLRLFEWLDRRCLRSADEIWVGSRHAEADVRRGLPGRVRVRRFDNAIDPRSLAGAVEGAWDARAALGLPVGALLIGMHARMHRGKGHHVLAEAVLQSRRTDVHAVLLGYGDEAASLRALAQSPRARGRIHVPGEQPPERVLATVAALDVYAYASLRESMPLAVIEAMALGRPIIATAVGDLPDALEHGAGGVLVPPGDASALAVAIDALAVDPARRAALGARAQETARARYFVDRLGAAMTDAWLGVQRRSRP